MELHSSTLENVKLFLSTPLAIILKNIRDRISKIIPPNNRLTTAPPGSLIQKPGKPIIVSSLMRSGTHILIDVIINNFKIYKRKPLYIDLDQWIKAGLPIEKLYNVGPYIIKTHFPQGYPTNSHFSRDIGILAEKAINIQPKRNIYDVKNSLARFESERLLDRFESDINNFGEFWSNYNKLVVPFYEIIDRRVVIKWIDELARTIEINKRNKLYLPPKKSATLYVITLKLLTRVLGKYSPIVNTTIGFSLKR